MHARGSDNNLYSPICEGRGAPPCRVLRRVWARAAPLIEESLIRAAYLPDPFRRACRRINFDAEISPRDCRGRLRRGPEPGPSSRAAASFIIPISAGLRFISAPSRARGCINCARRAGRRRETLPRLFEGGERFCGVFGSF